MCGYLTFDMADTVPDDIQVGEDMDDHTHSHADESMSFSHECGVARLNGFGLSMEWQKHLELGIRIHVNDNNLENNHTDI